MITWTPTINPISLETGKYARFKRIVKGKHDKYIKNFARAIKKYNKPVWIRPFHEINATFFPWSRGWGKFYNPNTGARTTGNDNTPKLYRKAWVRVYNLFQKVGAKKAKFLWTVAKQSCKGCNPYKKYYPPKGRGVFMAGFSNFNWGGFNGRTWNSFEQSMKQPMRNFKQFTKRPIVLAELGTTHLNGPGGQTKSQWLLQGFPRIHKLYPKVKAAVYQHVNNNGQAHGHPNWNLNDPPGSINAYKTLLTKTKFKGKVNKKGKVY
jgi:beta-mannanase